MGTKGRGEGISYDSAALDEAERLFWREVWDSVVEDAVEERGIELKTFGPVQASIVADLPGVQMLNLVLGAAEPGAADEGHLAEAIDWVESHGVNYYVPVTPRAPGAAAAEDWLNQNGFERGYSWMKFVRDAAPPDFESPPGVEVFEIGEDEGEGLAWIAAEGFGLPRWATAFFFDLPGRVGWRCYVAVVDDAAQACASMFIHDGIAEFGIAATLESARGRGCQTALLHRRIRDAVAAGCHTLFVETGERQPERPSASYRNILRAGFKEAYLRPNWQPSALSGGPPRS